MIGPHSSHSRKPTGRGTIEHLQIKVLRFEEKGGGDGHKTKWKKNG